MRPSFGDIPFVVVLKGKQRKTTTWGPKKDTPSFSVSFAVGLLHPACAKESCGVPPATRSRYPQPLPRFSRHPQNGATVFKLIFPSKPTEQRLLLSLLLFFLGGGGGKGGRHPCPFVHLSGWKENHPGPKKRGRVRP